MLVFPEINAGIPQQVPVHALDISGHLLLFEQHHRCPYFQKSLCFRVYWVLEEVLPVSANNYLQQASSGDLRLVSLLPLMPILAEQVDPTSFEVCEPILLCLCGYRTHRQILKQKIPDRECNRQEKRLKQPGTRIQK